MSAVTSAEWCRARAAQHAQQAEEMTGDRRAFHTREAASWNQEVLYWEAMAKSQRRRLTVVK